MAGQFEYFGDPDDSACFEDVDSGCSEHEGDVEGEDGDEVDDVEGTLHERWFVRS